MVSIRILDIQRVDHGSELQRHQIRRWMVFLCRTRWWKNSGFILNRLRVIRQRDKHTYSTQSHTPTHIHTYTRTDDSYKRECNEINFAQNNNAVHCFALIHWTARSQTCFDWLNNKRAILKNVCAAYTSSDGWQIFADNSNTCFCSVTRRHADFRMETI